MLKLGEARLPDYPVPAGSTPDGFLRAEAQRGLAQRLAAAAASRGDGRCLPRSACSSSSTSSARWVSPATS